jgi:hypothetical protein
MLTPLPKNWERSEKRTNQFQLLKPIKLIDNSCGENEFTYGWRPLHIHALGTEMGMRKETTKLLYEIFRKINN